MMKKGLQEEESTAVDNIQQEVAPVKRKRGRPPSKNKNQNASTENRKLQRTLESQNEGKHVEFQYPPQIPFNGFDIDQNLKESSISTPFFRNIIDKILGLWWNGSSPILCDDTKIIEYEIVFNMFRFLKYLFDSLPPFLIITNPEHINQWLSTFIGYQSYLYTDNENDTTSDIFYTNKSKTKLDVLILSSEQDLSNFSLTNFSLLILDQPKNFDNLSYLGTLDVKSKFLICNSSTENVPSEFDFDNHVLVTLNDMKNNRYVSEILHFCPMTQLQILQTQQLFKSNKSRLHQIPEPPSERLTMFLSHMVKQVKSISVHPSLSTNYNSPSDDQSGKFQELLKIVINLQKSENKIAIIGQDPTLLKFTASYFIKNKINAYNVNQLLKGKKKAQLIEEYNQSDSLSLLLIDPENFFEFNTRLIIDKIIILEVEISLDSMIDEILSWQQAQHDNTPQIIRLVTDNSIELPIYEMQFNNRNQEIGNENENEEDESKKMKKEEEIQNQFYDFDKMKSETLLLLLKQSAILCFESDDEIPRKPMEVCYSHSPAKLFEIETDFHQNFWNDITQIEFHHHHDGTNSKNQQRIYKQQSISRIGNQSKIDSNSEDNSSIATRVKKEFLRRARFIDPEKVQKTEKVVKVKMSTRNSNNNKKDDNDDDDNDEPIKKPKLKKIKKIVRRSRLKNRQSPRQKKIKKYNESDSASDEELEIESNDENESESDDDDESESESEYEKKENDSFIEEEEEDDDDDDEDDEDDQEESENEKINIVEIEDSESDENESIAARKKKRLLKLQQLQQKLEEEAIKKSKKSAKKSTKKLKLTKKTKKSTETKLKQQQQQQQFQLQQQSLQKPRKHIPKFDSMVAFWNPRQFAHYLEILHDFGFDRWDKFAVFERPIQELRKIGALIIRNLETTSRENRLLREYFANELRSSELSRLDNALPFVRRKLSKINRSDFLADLTGMLLIAKLAPKSIKDIILPKACSEIDPLDSEWTEDDDRTLIFLIYENGLFHIPTTFKHSLSKDFIRRFRSFFTVDPNNLNSPNIVSLTSGSASFPKTKLGVSNYDSKQSNQTSISKSVSLKKKGSISASSSSSLKGKTKNQADNSSSSSVSIKPARGIGLKLHLQIIRTLCSFGYPGLPRFKAQMKDVGIVSDVDLEDYIQTILNYSICTVKEERRILAMKLAGKIEKYTATKIVSRKNMFDKIRRDATDYDNISAEDIELLAAMGFHGFQNTENSPVLLSSCGGECSDQRLFQRVKAISMQEQIHNEEPISSFINQSKQEQQEKQEQEQNAQIEGDFNLVQTTNENIENQSNQFNENQYQTPNFEQQEQNENQEIIPPENDQIQPIQPNDFTEPTQINEQNQDGEQQQIIESSQQNEEIGQIQTNDQIQLNDQNQQIESFESSTDHSVQPDQSIINHSIHLDHSHLDHSVQPEQNFFDNSNQSDQSSPENLIHPDQFTIDHSGRTEQNIFDHLIQSDQSTPNNSIESEQNIFDHSNQPNQSTPNNSIEPEQNIYSNSNQPDQTTLDNSIEPEQNIYSNSNQPDQTTLDNSIESEQNIFDHSNQPDQSTLDHSIEPDQSLYDQSVPQNPDIEAENESNSLEESLFPLRLNDRQVLKSIGTIDPRFHDDNYIYPIDYEIAVACTNPFNDSQNLIWLNLSVRLLSMKIDKTDRTNKNGDFLVFVVRKEREKSTEISDDSPEKVFEKVRQRIMRKTKTWMPPFDGNEMFGFNSAKVHRILSEMPEIEQCTRYRRRFFRLPMQIDHEWPILGRYEDKKKQLLMYTMFTSGENGNQNKISNQDGILSSNLPPSLNKNSISLNKKIKNLKKLKQKVTNKKEKNKPDNSEKSQFSLMKKKEFGNLVKPLVLNLRPIFNSGFEEASVSVTGTAPNLDELMDRYQKWDKDIIQKYLP